MSFRIVIKILSKYSTTHSGGVKPMATTVGSHRKQSRRESTSAGAESAPRRSARVTLKDIADKANVSIAAVSLALADRPGIGAETKSKVLRLSREMGYVPRRDPLLDRANDRTRLMKQRLGFLLLGGKLEHENYLGMLHALMVNSA